MPPKRRNQKGPMMINLDAEDDDQLIVDKTNNEQQNNQKKLDNPIVKEKKEEPTSTSEISTSSDAPSETKKIQPVHVDYCKCLLMQGVTNFYCRFFTFISM